MQIADGIWHINLRSVNAYILATGKGAVIVDAGTPGSSQSILQELRFAGYGPADVRAIVVTHAHLDHIGSLVELQEATGAPICASAGEAAAIEGRIPLPSPPGLRGLLLDTASALLRPTPVPVQHRLYSGASIPLLPEWHAVGTPGHTPDHMSLYNPQRAFLIAGDALMNFGGIGRPPWIVTSDLTLARRSVALMAGLPLHHVVFGHGKPILNDALLSQRLAQIAVSKRS
jgi:glyoxylase-like metal-dependent hydrolase (beta-lactamase superfamily II)